MNNVLIIVYMYVQNKAFLDKKLSLRVFQVRRYGKVGVQLHLLSYFIVQGVALGQE